MKKYPFIFILFLFNSIMIQAQNKDYKVVFDLSSKDSVNQISIIREIGLITGSSPDVKIEVVIYGQGLDLAIKDRTTLQSAVEKIISENKATFKVCAMTMKRNNIDKSQLVPGFEIVPDGIYELFSKQQQGWGYIKVGH